MFYLEFWIISKNSLDSRINFWNLHFHLVIDSQPVFPEPSVRVRELFRRMRGSCMMEAQHMSVHYVDWCAPAASKERGRLSRQMESWVLSAKSQPKEPFMLQDRDRVPVHCRLGIKNYNSCPGKLKPSPSTTLDVVMVWLSDCAVSRCLGSTIFYGFLVQSLIIYLASLGRVANRGISFLPFWGRGFTRQHFDRTLTIKIDFHE